MSCNDFDKGLLFAKRRPLASAVTAALASVVLGGCASDLSSRPYRGQSEVERASEAYARKDFKNAAELLSEPAMKGDRDAQYALGYMYYYGQGVPQDHYRAQSWLETAAKLGHPDAKRALSMLKVYSKLPRTPEQPATVATTEAPRAATAPVATVPAARLPVATAQDATTPKSAVPDQANETPAPVQDEIRTEAQTATVPVAPASEAAPAQVKPDEAGTTAQPPLPTSEEQPPTTLTARDPADEIAAEIIERAAVVPQPAPVTGRASDASAERSEPPVVAAEQRPAVAPAESVSTQSAPKQESASPNDPSDVVVDQGAEPVVVALDRAAPSEVTLVAGSNKPLRLKARRVKLSARIENSGAAHPRYTLHLMSSRSKEDIDRVVRAHGLESGAAFYQVKQADGVHYRLIYGGFNSVAAARDALHALPQSIYGSSPWVNNYPVDTPVTRFNGVALQQMAENKRTLR